MIHKTRDDNGVLTHYMNKCVIGSKQVRGYYREAEAKLSSRFGLETIGHGHGHFKFLRTTFVCDECGNKLRSTQTVDEGKEVKCGECEKYSLTLV